MQGDPKVDELMRPVNAAIRRHVKNGDAVTDIYNRAYEALMISMDVKAGKTYCAYCAYCGAEYPLDDNAAAQVSEHIKTCEKHPMRAVEARAEAAEARVHELQAALDAAINMNIEKNAEVVRLTAALAAANEDAARLASVLEDDGYPVKKLPMNAKRLSLAAHRARVGGAS